MMDRPSFRISQAAVSLAGHHYVLAATGLTTGSWCILGLAVGLPQEWFLLTNMLGSLVTLFFLLLMQHSQNRDMHALQTKADELILSSENARNHLIGVERREEVDLQQMVDDRHADA